MILKTLKHVLLSAVLLVSATVLVTSAPQTFAAPAASHARMCPAPCLPQPPTLITSGQFGVVYITGAHWTPNSWVSITVYMPVSAGGSVSFIEALTDKYGNINTSWTAPNSCLYQAVEVQAYDGIHSVLTNYPVPGCVFFYNL